MKSIPKRNKVKTVEKEEYVLEKYVDEIEKMMA
jgi:hypothetical protein